MRILLKGMSMNNLIKLHIHQQVQDFLRRINQNDRQSLLKYNQVTDENFMIESNISLYTTNFTEPLSYQDSAFLKLPKFP